MTKQKNTIIIPMTPELFEKTLDIVVKRLVESNSAFQENAGDSVAAMYCAKHGFCSVLQNDVVESAK